VASQIQQTIIKPIEQCALIRVSLLDLEASLNQPQLKKLIGEGWQVMSSFAVEENNKPYLIIILKPPMDLHRVSLNYYYFIPLVLISIFSFIEIILHLIR